MLAGPFGAVFSRFGKDIVFLAEVLFRHMADRTAVRGRAEFEVSADLTDKYAHKTLLFSCF